MLLVDFDFLPMAHLLSRYATFYCARSGRILHILSVCCPPEIDGCVVVSRSILVGDLVPLWLRPMEGATNQAMYAKTFRPPPFCEIREGDDLIALLGVSRSQDAPASVGDDVTTVASTLRPNPVY